MKFFYTTEELLKFSVYTESNVKTVSGISF